MTTKCKPNCINYDGAEAANAASVGVVVCTDDQLYRDSIVDVRCKGQHDRQFIVEI